MSYVSTDDAINRIIGMESHAVLAKVDNKHAFRPLYLADRHL